MEEGRAGKGRQEGCGEQAVLDRMGQSYSYPGRIHMPAGATALEPPIPSPVDVSIVQPCRHVAQPTPAGVTKNPKPIIPKHLGSRYTLLANNSLKWPKHLVCVYGHLSTGLGGGSHQPFSSHPQPPSPPALLSLSPPFFAGHPSFPHCGRTNNALPSALSPKRSHSPPPETVVILSAAVLSEYISLMACFFVLHM